MRYNFIIQLFSYQTEMKLSGLVFTFLEILVVCHLQKNKVDYKALSIALQNISRGLSETNRSVYVEKLFDDNNTIQKVILKSFRDENVPVIIRTIKDQNRSFCPVPSILTLGQMLSPETYSNLIRRDCHRSPETILYVHWINAGRKEIQKHSQVIFMDLSYFILDEGEFIKLLTFRRYPSLNCTRGDLIEINKFSKQTLRWKSNKFKEQRFSDFHGCNLT